MINVRKAADRGHFDFGWLNTYHTFSFGNYYDPANMSFRSLRVMNEDRVNPAGGFPTHPHRDMEIITCILEGALEHRDSMGNSSVIRPGEFQKMSAGTGITHSEFNPSNDKPVHLYQIWIIPDEEGLTPYYDQREFPIEERIGKLVLVGSKKGLDGSITIHQDVDLYVSKLEKGMSIGHELRSGRYAWIQVMDGSLQLDGAILVAGDGASIWDHTKLDMRAVEESNFLLFDLG